MGEVDFMINLIVRQGTMLSPQCVETCVASVESAWLVRSLRGQREVCVANAKSAWPV